MNESVAACETQCASRHVPSLIQTCFQYAVSNVASDPDILNHNPPTGCLYLFFFNALYPHEDLSPTCSNLIPSPEPCSVPPGHASLKCSPIHILVNTVIQKPGKRCPLGGHQLHSCGHLSTFFPGKTATPSSGRNWVLPGTTWWLSKPSLR